MEQTAAAIDGSGAGLNGERAQPLRDRVRRRYLVRSAPSNRLVGRGMVLLVTLVLALQPSVLLAAGNTWTSVAPMPIARYLLAGATGRDGRIYAIGGFASNGNILNTVEAYTPSTNTWSTVAPMPTARAYLAAATGTDGRIYAIGGYNGGSVLNTVEAYTPSTDTWSSVASMPTTRFVLAAASGTDGRIYAIGGYNGSSYLKTVEAYTPSTNTWATVLPMHTARDGLAAATGADGRIYVIGGYNGSAYLDTVEAYTPSSPTVARLTALHATQRGSNVHFSWRVADARGIVAFELYARTHRLTRQPIAVHAGTLYRRTVAWRGGGPYSLHVILRNGTDLTVPVR